MVHAFEDKLNIKFIEEKLTQNEILDAKKLALEKYSNLDKKEKNYQI
jgi:lipoate-protein ligase A